MKNTIHKYRLSGDSGFTTISLPIDSKPLCVQMQNGHLELWCLIDGSETQLENVNYRVYGTGWIMPDNPGVYIGTVQTTPFVWHVFKEMSPNVPR